MEPSSGCVISNLAVGNFKLLLPIFLQRKHFTRRKQSTKYLMDRKLRTAVQMQCKAQ